MSENFNTETAAKFIKDLETAARLDSSRIYPTLFEYIGYRKAIAQQILVEQDDLKKENLKEMFDQASGYIKQLIGLE